MDVNEGIIIKDENGNTLKRKEVFDYTCKPKIKEVLNVRQLKKIIILPQVFAKEPEPPKRPPPMKYKDLPVYESPHYEYKDYEEDKLKCPNRHTKIIHSHLYPYVSTYRRSWSASIFDLTKEMGLMKNEICQFLCDKGCQFKCTMRHPDNIMARQAVLAASTLFGVCLGSGTRGITRKLFFGSIGAVSAGALCFPKETDEVVRNVSYHFAKSVFYLYNAFCKKDFKFREKGPCKDDIPPQCPKHEAPKKKECKPK